MDGKYFVLISILFNVLGQYSMKFGIRKFGIIHFDKDIISTMIKIFTLPNILLGLFLYGISAIFWIIALSKVELSVAYPMLSIGYILIMIISYFLLHEPISMYKIIGTLLIIVGILFISHN